MSCRGTQRSQLLEENLVHHLGPRRHVGGAAGEAGGEPLQTAKVAGRFAVARLGHLRHREQQRVLGLTDIVGAGTQAAFQLPIGRAQVPRQMLVAVQRVFHRQRALDAAAQLGWHRPA